MQDILARLGKEAEEFLEGKDYSSDVERREDEVILAWYNEFDRMIYNTVLPNERVEVGIMLIDETPVGSTQYMHKRMSDARPESVDSTWDFCYNAANQYSSQDLEIYQTNSFL